VLVESCIVSCKSAGIELESSVDVEGASDDAAGGDDTGAAVGGNATEATGNRGRAVARPVVGTALPEYRLPGAPPPPRPA
jgi:hypothetical protein